MSSAPVPAQIWQDARWLAQALDPPKGLVRLVEMTPEAYRDASFLDDRMLQQARNAQLVAWGDVADAMPADARTDARWIFHIGHVGSTLVSRLLGELDGVLALREPRALRDLTFFPPDVRGHYTTALAALLSRTFSPQQKALVKATSIVSEIAGDIIPRGGRALFLYTTPLSYIAGILAGENSRQELSGLAETRRQRLLSRGIALPPALSEADLAAAAWACEMTALESATGATVMWADFDRFLEDVEGCLKRITGFFGFPASDEHIAEIARGPLMRRYSKATEHEYSPELRRELLSQARDRHRAEIETALAMLAAQAETAPLLRRALERAQAEI